MNMFWCVSCLLSKNGKENLGHSQVKYYDVFPLHSEIRNDQDKNFILLAICSIRPILFLEYKRSWTNISFNLYRCILPSDNYTMIYAEETCLRPADSSDSWTKFGEYYTCNSVPIRWIWGLMLIIMTPEFFVFVRSLWTIGFKKERKPSLRTLLTASHFLSIYLKFLKYVTRLP